MIIIPRYIQQVQAAGKKAKSGVPTATITTTKVGTFSMTLRGYAGSLTVDWGDGSAPEIVTLLGTGVNVVISHNYIASGSKTIRFYDDYENITYVSGNTQSITSALRSFISKLINLTYITLNNNPMGENIEWFAPVVGKLTWLAISNCACTGDISVLASLNPSCSLIYFGTNYLTCNNEFIMPPVSGTDYSFNSCFSRSLDVDNTLKSFYVGGVHDCNLYVAGTDPSRTSDSDTAYNGLLANNVVVSVNPP